ncbi:MAG: tetratricopeptide repeat protein, partial [Verrucomicrobiales bacterium]
MKSSHPLPFLLAGILAVSGPGRAAAGLPFFGKDKMKEVPASEELVRQDTDAKALLEKAVAAKTENKLGTAEDILETLIEKYPLTASAATAPFELGRVHEADAKPEKAFDDYQKFIEEHRESDLFGEAVRRQFELATLAMNGKTSSFFGVIPAKAQGSKVIEYFGKVAANAPHSTYAPLALFNVGVLQKEAGKQPEAITAFERLVNDYPGDPKSKEAALEIIAIREGRETNDDSQIQQAQLEMEKFITDFSNDPRSGELQAKVGKLEDREAEKKFTIARYYERKGNLKA